LIKLFQKFGPRQGAPQRGEPKAKENEKLRRGRVGDEGSKVEKPGG